MLFFFAYLEHLITGGQDAEIMLPKYEVSGVIRESQFNLLILSGML